MKVGLVKWITSGKGEDTMSQLQEAGWRGD